MASRFTDGFCVDASKLMPQTRWIGGCGKRPKILGMMLLKSKHDQIDQRFLMLFKIDATNLFNESMSENLII